MSSIHDRTRLLREEEKALIRELIERTKQGNEILDSLDSLRVHDLLDGGMGSVRTVSLDDVDQRKAVPIALAEYLDSDNILISVQITCDQAGRLFEIDIWKTDFSPVIRYPNSSARLRHVST